MVVLYASMFSWLILCVCVFLFVSQIEHRMVWLCLVLAYFGHSTLPSLEAQSRRRRASTF